MQATKRLYESTFIVNASLDDPQIDQVVARVQEFIVSNGGEVTSLNKWGRKRLAYAIRKKNNGFYVVAEFHATGQLINQLERLYLLDENIIRSLTIQIDKKALKARTVPPVPTTSELPSPPLIEKEPLFEDEEETK